jgi:biotin-dependent carboxylase-like uncharacterized protein
MTLVVVEPGAASAVRDLGRTGFRAFGVPTSGAFDPFALRAANRLVGNSDGAGALEITLSGPTLSFETDRFVALAGAPFDMELDGAPAPRNASIAVRAGQTLRIGRTAHGLRAYLAIAGGVEGTVPLGGRAPRLAAGDLLSPAPSAGPPVPRRLRRDPLAPISGDATLRVVSGEDLTFTPATRDAFLASVWTVSPRSDRAGVRLDGEPLRHSGAADMDPEGVVPGAVQVPGDGRPIVLGPDGPVTGGYVTIATVIAADVSRLGQARPGDTLRFAAVTVEQGRRAWRELEEALEHEIEDIG